MRPDFLDSENAALPLAGLRVGISGAVPEREYWGDVPDLERQILSFVAQLSALVIKYGGTVVHGSQPLLTPVVAEAASQSSEHHEAPLTLIASQLWGELPAVAARAAGIAKKTRLILVPKIGAGDMTDRPTRDNSLTALRLRLAQEVDVLVAIGGKFHSGTGFNPGVLEELTVARWMSVPCFIVAGFGGVAGSLEKDLLHEFSDGNLMPTGTSDPKQPGEVVAMATWNDTVDEYVGTLLAHFARNHDRFIGRRRLSVSKNIEPLQVMAGIPVTVVQADTEEVTQFSAEFSRLRKALGEADIDTVLQTIRTPSWAEAGREPGMPSYRATILNRVENVEGRHEKQSGGRGQYAACWISVEPIERGKDFEFVNQVPEGAAPSGFVPAVEKGIREASAHGHPAGFPVVDFRATLHDGNWHEVGSDEQSFEMAGQAAFQNAMEQAGIALLEPIMKVEITAPDDFTQTILSDLNSRRGRIAGMEPAEMNSVITAEVPMAALLTYRTDLASMTEGRGSFNMEMSHYALVPSSEAEKIAAQAGHGQVAGEKEAQR